MTISLPSKNNMCRKKKSFHSKALAEKVAEKFGQRVYECPICFCWHCTSKADWRDEYVDRDSVQMVIDMLSKSIFDLKGKHKLHIQNLEFQIQNLKKKLERK